MKEKSWINTSRAIGIVCVYLYHSEIYLHGDSITGFLYTPFFMSIFFFVSGYLFFASKKGIKDRFERLLTKMLWPYFLFCSLIFFPKILARGYNITLYGYFSNIFGGQASWFITAMIVLQIIFLAGYKWIKDSRLWLIIGVVVFCIVQFLNDGVDNSPWCYKTALQSLWIFALGGVFYKYEVRLVPYISWKSCAPIVAIYLVFVSILEPFALLRSFNNEMIILKVFVAILGMMGVIILSYQIKPVRIIQYIGRNTLPLYFMSGGFPLIYSFLLRSIPLNSFLSSILVFVLSIVSGIISTYLIKRYLPFMLDITLIRQTKYRQCS